MIGPIRPGQVHPGIRTDRRVGTTVTGSGDPVIVPDHRHLRNRRCRVKLFQSHRHLLLTANVMIAIPCRTSNRPWSTKSGLAGKDIADLRVTELTRKGLDDFSLRCLSNGEFQSIAFVKSISEAVFVSNLLGHIRQDRLDLDAVAANMHGSAPPDKQKESARFMQPLLGEVVSTIKSSAPAPAMSSAQSPESDELARAKRKLQEAGIALTPEKKPRAAQGSPSSTGPALPTTGSKSPGEQILEKELATKPNTVPSSHSKEAMDK